MLEYDLTGIILISKEGLIQSNVLAQSLLFVFNSNETSGRQTLHSSLTSVATSSWAGAFVID